MNNIFSAVKAIIQKDNKFLIVKQEVSGHIFWDFPGGRVEYGESPYDTLFREVQEEVSLKVKILKPLGLCWFFRLDGNQVICNTFLCEAENMNIDITKNPAIENISEYKWVTKEEFASDEYVVSHESMKDIVKLI